VTGSWLATLVVLAALAFWVYALVDFSRTPERDIATFSRSFWLVLLVLGSVVGAVAWFAVGRPAPRRPR